MIRFTRRICNTNDKGEEDEISIEVEIDVIKMLSISALILGVIL